MGRSGFENSSKYVFDWSPESKREQVHWLIAERNRNELRERWGTVMGILEDDLAAEHYLDAVKACLYIGNDEIAPTLCALLKSGRGGSGLATILLNSGHSTLEYCAEAWARRNGYTISKYQGGGGGPRWNH